MNPLDILQGPFAEVSVGHIAFYVSLLLDLVSN